MTTTERIRGGVRSWKLGLQAFWFLLATSLTASAAHVDGTPSQVEFAGLLMVRQGGVLYRAELPTVGCGIPANSVDTVKMWVNLAQAALLSGKNLRIYFSVCNGNNYIRDLVLVR